MKAPPPDARARSLPFSFAADPTEARLIERAIAVARTLLSVAAVLIVRIDPPAPSQYGGVTNALLFGYLAFAALVLLMVVPARKVFPPLAVAVQAVDIALAAALTLFSSGPGSPLYTFLLYPLLAAAYRWGFLEVMITAVVVDALIGLEALLVASNVVFMAGGAPIALNQLLLRAIYVGALGAAVGYLAENERRRRREARDVSMVLMQARLGGKLTETVNLALAALRRVFGADEVLLAMREKDSGRTWLWKTAPAGVNPDEAIAARPELLPASKAGDYLFEVPGMAWHAAARLWRRNPPFSVVAVDELGQRVPASAVTPPEGFLQAHRCRRLLGVSVLFGEEWVGRILIVGPAPGSPRDQLARFALDVMRQVAPAAYGQYLMRRLRHRAQALERGRIARELHDGVTQSLLGLEMELVVLHRRARDQAPEMTHDLGRLHQIVRREVINVRELMEGVRVGDVESGDLLQHLGEMVDRFGRYTGIAARFVSDGREVPLTPHLRRQVGRIVHEALINVRKHADADRVAVRAEVDSSCWRLSIEDDGRGFPFAGRLSQEELERFRQGPRTIRERVRLIGGSMAVESRPGFGSKIEIGIPLRTAS